MDHIQFENLAMAYAKDNYPEYDWIATSITRDGNKDGYTTFKKKTMGITSEHEAWMEAKYSKRSRSVGRSRLDSTIVSGLLHGNVKVIMFITNGSIPKEYILRAQKIFIQSNDQHLLFIDNQNMTYWLINNPIIHNRFFTSKPKNIGRPENIIVSGLNILTKSDYNRALYSKVSKCKTEIEYVVNILIDSNISKRVEILLSSEQNVIISKSSVHDVIPGKNSFWKKLVVREIGKFQITANVIDGLINETIATKSIDIIAVKHSNPIIVHSQQLKLLLSLLNHIKRDVREEKGANFCISATGGMGKSFLLEQLQNEDFAGASVHRLDMTGSEGIDAQQLCKAILIFNFGVIYNYKDIYESLLSSDISTITLKTVSLLLAGLNDSRKAVEALKELAENDEFRSLLSPLSRSNHKVLLFDDIHKVSPLISLFLIRIASTITKYRPNTTALFAFRCDEFTSDGLLLELKCLSSIFVELNAPSVEDILKSFNANRLYVNEHTISVFFSNNPIMTLSLCNILDEVCRRIDSIKTEYGLSSGCLEVIKEVVNGRDKIIEDSFRRFKHFFKLLDVVYAFSNGIKIEHIIRSFDFASKKSIDLLVKGKLIRVEDQCLYPFHDTYINKYSLLRKGLHKAHVGKVFVQLSKETDYPRTECLSHLIRCGKRYSLKYLNEAIVERDYLRSKGVYGQNLNLSRSICKVLEDTPNLLSEHDFLKSYFIYAECLNHCGESQKARGTFEIVSKLATHKCSAMNVAIDGMKYDAEAEILSLDYWALKASAVQLTRLTDFAEKMNQLISITKNSDRYIQAYLTALNRIMTTHLLLDNYDSAAVFFNLSLKESKRLNKYNYNAYAHSDYAKGLYVYSPQKALVLLEKADYLYRELGTQNRRLLVGEVEKSYLSLIYENGSMDSLYEKSNILLQKGLFSEYRNAVLKIVAVLLSRGGHHEAMEKLSGLMTRLNTSFGPRSQMLISNLLTVYNHLLGDENGRNKYVKKHYAISSHLGSTYSGIAKINYNAPISSRIAFSLSEKLDPECTYLDPRQW